MAPATSKLLLSDNISQFKTVPPNYIRPTYDRPNLIAVADFPIPLVDVQGNKGSDRSRVVKEIGLACCSNGFFQIKNHGIPEDLINSMLSTAKEFFSLPESERLKNYSSDPSKETRLSTSFNVSTEKVSNWRDYLRLHCYPVENFVHDWPSNPPQFREVVAEYSKKVRELALIIMEAISESLGLEKDSIIKSLGKQAQHMAINYYPPCPQPELTYGLPAHKDPNAITMLLQDGVQSGLQVLRNGKWVPVNPIPYTFVVNIGDVIQALSNDRYKSVLHRAVVNRERERISIPTFYCPSPEALIRPFKELVDEDHQTPYIGFTYQEYHDRFWNKGLQSASNLDLFKSTNTKIN